METRPKDSWMQGVNWGLGQPCQKREGSAQAWVGVLSAGVQAPTEFLPRQFLLPSKPSHPPTHQSKVQVSSREFGASQNQRKKQNLGPVFGPGSL